MTLKSSITQKLWLQTRCICFSSVAWCNETTVRSSWEINWKEWNLLFFTTPFCVRPNKVSYCTIIFLKCYFFSSISTFICCKYSLLIPHDLIPLKFKSILDCSEIGTTVWLHVFLFSFCVCTVYMLFIDSPLGVLFVQIYISITPFLCWYKYILFMKREEATSCRFVFVL